jgi:hypothetical protein
MAGILYPAPDDPSGNPSTYTDKDGAIFSGPISLITALREGGSSPPVAGSDNPLAGLDRLGKLIVKHESGARPYIGTGNTDLTPYLEKGDVDANGFPNWPGIPTKYGPSTAAGLFQITRTNWSKYAPQVGVTDFSTPSQIKVYKAMRDENGGQPWLGQSNDGVPFNAALRAAYYGGKDPGDIALNGSTLPALGKARLAAALMPNSAGGDDPSPSTAQSQQVDPTAQLLDMVKGLSTTGYGYNPSKLLATWRQVSLVAKAQRPLWRAVSAAWPSLRARTSRSWHSLPRPR